MLAFADEQWMIPVYSRGDMEMNVMPAFRVCHFGG